MKIVIFGSSGYVGSSLAPYLLSENHSLTLINRKHHYIPNAKSIVVNSLFDMHLYYSELKCADIVIYLSGLAHVSSKLNFSNLDLYLSANYYPLVFVAQLCASIGIRRFIFFSTSKVLGEFSPPGVRFTNSTDCNPSNSYSFSKYLCEKFLFSLTDIYSTDIVVLRPPLVYGGFPKGNINSLLRILRLHIPLPLRSLTLNKRSMISLSNINRFVSCIINFPSPINSSLLISDGNDFSTVEFVNYIGFLHGIRPILFHFPLPIIAFLFRLLKPNYFYTLICSYELDISSTCDLLDFKP